MAWSWLVKLRKFLSIDITVFLWCTYNHWAPCGLKVSISIDGI